MNFVSISEEPSTTVIDKVFVLSKQYDFRPKQLISIVGYPKMGKTFWMSALAEESKKYTLYYSLERKIEVKSPNVVYFSKVPTFLEVLSDIENYKPEWIIIDTLDMFMGNQYLDEELRNFTFNRLKKLALDKNLTVFIIQHLSPFRKEELCS